jgi:hypothetical protein
MSLEARPPELAPAQSIRRYDHAPSGSTTGSYGGLATASQPQRQYQPLPRAAVTNPISIAIDPVALITTECITVTSAMRKHTRWAQSSVSAILGGSTSISNGRESAPSLGRKDQVSPVSHLPRRTTTVPGGLEGVNDTLASRWGLRGKKGKSMQDNPLMSAFARLRHDLRECRGQHGGTKFVNERFY